MKKKIITGLILAVLFLCVMPAALATIRVSSNIEMDSRGYVEISWTDTGYGAPYKVCFTCTEGTAKQREYIGATNVSTTKCAIQWLCPGIHYKITVYDKNGDRASTNIRVPRRQDLTSGRKRVGTIEYRYKTDQYVADSAASKLKTLSASAIERNLKKGYVYGFYHNMKYTSRAKTSNIHKAVFAMIAPNGYVYTETSSDYTLPRTKGNWYYNFIGGDFFTHMYEDNGYIATGRYTFAVFLEGRQFFSVNFTVKD